MRGNLALRAFLIAVMFARVAGSNHGGWRVVEYVTAAVWLIMAAGETVLWLRWRHAE